MGAEKTRKKLGEMERDQKGRFVSGHTLSVGNKGGRPPIIRHIRDLAREQTEPAFAALVDIAMHGVSESARVAALRELFDRGWGKSAQPLTGSDLGPIEFRRAKDLTDDELAAIATGSLELTDDELSAIAAD